MRFGIGNWLPSDTFNMIADWTGRFVPGGGSVETTWPLGRLLSAGDEDDLETGGLQVRGGLIDGLPRHVRYAPRFWAGAHLDGDVVGDHRHLTGRWDGRD